MFSNYAAEDLIERTETLIKYGFYDHLKSKNVNMTGLELITQERHEQITKHGRTIEQDKAQNNECQLTDAATALVIAVPEGMENAYLQCHGNFPPVGWNREIWNNMLKKPYKERLVIAGALIAAELDRINN